MSGKSIQLQEDDWELLFNQQSKFKIGHTTLILRPLGLAQFAFVVKEIAAMAAETGILGDEPPQGIKSNMWRIPAIAATIRERAPGVLATLSGLNEEDVERLPPVVAVELFKACVEINIKSQEMLEKKLQSMAGEINRMVHGSPSR
ncbi:MAG: hypothetical protein HQL52_20155 [Magnetococcales bacterium]|nr:hypothetical protein [Magnetococcales bacterium]